MSATTPVTAITADRESRRIGPHATNLGRNRRPNGATNQLVEGPNIQRASVMSSPRCQWVIGADDIDDRVADAHHAEKCSRRASQWPAPPHRVARVRGVADVRGVAGLRSPAWYFRHCDVMFGWERVVITVSRSTVHQSDERGCHWCGRRLAPNPIGRPRRYCRQSCRQRAYESRRRSSELGLGDDELIVTRNELDDARDRLFLIGSAVADARADIDDDVSLPVVLDRLIGEIDSIAGENPSR